MVCCVCVSAYVDMDGCGFEGGVITGCVCEARQKDVRRGGERESEQVVGWVGEVGGEKGMGGE